MPWRTSPEDKGCARVFYVDAEASELKPIDFPSDMELVSKLPEFSISFDTKVNLPGYDEWIYCHGSCDEDEFEKGIRALGFAVPEEIDEVDCKLLGYADLLQSCMLADCENAPHRIDRTNGEHAEVSKEWTLLFQMGTLEKKGFELMFGDCGNICFYIKKSDLERKDFDHIWLVLQSC